jgi:glycosyltransferase involved in cell wall biosynthesis
MPDVAERPPIATQPISVLLIAYNAAVDVEAVVTAWRSVLEALQRPFEIILVNDGSTDDTAMLVDILASEQPRLQVVHHATRLGFGAALRSALAKAQYPLLAYTTCDKQYDPADFKRLLELIDKVDLVTGLRQWLPVPRGLRALGRIYRILIRVLFGIPLDPLRCWLGDRGQIKRWCARWFFGVRVHDAECAFRLFRRSIFERIPIQSNGPFVQVEILAKANFLGCLMAEEAVSYRPPPGPPVWGSLSGGETYRSEARRLFGEPDFGAVDPKAAVPPEPAAVPQLRSEPPGGQALANPP